MIYVESQIFLKSPLEHSLAAAVYVQNRVKSMSFLKNITTYELW